MNALGRLDAGEPSGLRGLRARVGRGPLRYTYGSNAYAKELRPRLAGMALTAANMDADSFLGTSVNVNWTSLLPNWTTS